MTIDQMRCDSHVHIVGPIDVYPQISERNYLADIAPLDRLRSSGRARGITHFVVSQPSFYGIDNSALLDALDALQGFGRGVAVLDQQNISAADLRVFHERGIRGLRVNLYSPLVGKPLSSMDEQFNSTAELAQRNGWHVEVIAPIETLASHSGIIQRSQVPVVIDHYGLYGNARPNSELGRSLLGLMHSSNVWMKLSAPYKCARGAVKPDGAWVSELLAVAPDRCVWGSDWPHPPTHDSQKGPDIKIPYQSFSYSELFDSFAEAVPSPSALEAVMWDNPKRLYQF